MRAWMRLAAGMHVVASATLFGVVYLVVVPVFALISRLFDTAGWRPHGTPPSTWRVRRPTRHDESFFQRLG